MSDPSSVYMSGLRYYADRDPQKQEPAIQAFVITNFNSHNEVSWLNTTTMDIFILYNIINTTVDNNGVIVAGDLQWSKQPIDLLQNK